MTNRTSATMAPAAIAAMVAFSAAADGFRNPPPGGAGLGRGNAFAAQADDASAVHHNPANLSFLDSPEIEVSLALARMKTRVRSAAGFAATSEDDWQLLPNVFAAFPLSDSVTGGLGLTTPYGQSMEWPKDSPIAALSPYFAQMALVNANPSAGWKPNERLSLGAGVNLFSSSLELRSLHPLGEARAETAGFGLGANAGATLTVAEGHRLALTYRSPVSVDYDGDFKHRGAPPEAGLRDGDFETEIDFPDIAVLAYGADLAESVRGEIAVERIGWSAMKSLPVDAGPNQPLAGPPSIPYDWDDTWTFNAGFDWTFPAHWVARAGYSYVPSPVPSRTFSPLLPDADRHIVALGLGYQGGRHAVDVVWTLNFVDDRTIAGNQVPPFDGVYEIDPHLIALSYRYTFN